MTPFALLVAAHLSIASPQTPAAAPAPGSTEAVAEAYFLYLQGRSLDDAGDVKGAIDLYRKAIVLQPAAAGLHAELSMTYARTGQATEALAEALEALKTDADNRTAHRVMGFVQASLAESAPDPARQSNLESEAISHFEKALAGGARDLGVELTLGRLYVTTDQPQKAIPVLLLFLDDRPDYADAALALADAYEATHQVPDAVTVIESLVKDQPADVAARTRLAGLYEAAGRWRDAAAAWGELSRRNPQLMGYRTRQAAALANAGDFDASRTALTAIAQDAPRDVSVWYLLSGVERRSGHSAAAEDAARHIIEIDPKDPRGPLAVADARMSGKDFRGAVSVLQPLVDGAGDAEIQNGVFARAAGQLDAALEGAGDTPGALRSLEDARRRAPADDDLALTLASAYERAKNLDKAEATFRDVIAKDQSNAEALNDLGYMLADNGLKLDEAVGLIKRALVIEPDNPSYLDSLGWAYVKHGRPGDGRPSLEQAATALPRTSVILDHLAEAYFQLKRYKDAATAWDHALAGDLDGIDAAAITKKRDKARELAGK